MFSNFARRDIGGNKMEEENEEQKEDTRTILYESELTV